VSRIVGTFSDAVCRDFAPCDDRGLRTLRPGGPFDSGRAKFTQLKQARCQLEGKRALSEAFLPFVSKMRILTSAFVPFPATWESKLHLGHPSSKRRAFKEHVFFAEESIVQFAFFVDAWESSF
jgi:hypothetical protein